MDGPSIGNGVKLWSSERPFQSAAAVANPRDPLGAVIAFYLSMGHRAERMDGCSIVALGSDAA